MKGRMRGGAAVAVLALGICLPGVAAAATGGEADKTVAADVGGLKITVQEMDDYLRKTNSRAFQQYYDARRAALEGLIAEKLLAEEASAKGLTPEKLREQITASATVTDADVATFYEQNKARMGGRSIEQMREQIRSMLVGQKQQAAMSDHIRGLKQKKDVRVYLEPPRADVRIAETDPAKGPKSAPVQIVEFSDFQ